MSFNPYRPFQQQLAEVNHIAGGSTFLAIITFYQCLLGVSILLITASIAIRIAKQRENLWLFRMSNGFIRPHYVVTVLSLSSIFIVVDIFYLQAIRKYADINNLERSDSIAFRTLRFIPLAVGAWILSWATFLETITISKNTVTPKRFNFQNNYLVNSFFLGVPTFFVTLLLSTTLIANGLWQDCLVVYEQLRVALNLASKNFDKGIPQDIIGLQALQIKLTTQIDAMTVTWIRASSVLLGFIVAITVVLTLSSFAYFKKLRRSIQSTRRTVHPSLDSSTRLRNLEMTYASLLITTAIMEVMAITLFAAALFLTVNLEAIATQPALAEAIELCIGAVYPILGLFINAGLLYRTVALLHGPPQATGGSSQQTILSKSIPIELGKMDLPSGDYETRKLSGGRNLSLGAEEEKVLHIAHVSS